MYHGSPWLPQGNTNSNIFDHPPNIVLGSTYSNNLLHSNLQHPPNLLPLINSQTPVASALPPGLPQLQPPQLVTHLQHIPPPASIVTSDTNTAGALLLQQILASKATRSTPSTPRLGALQQHFVHNFSFTNSSNYHSQKKPPTPPRQPASPEGPAPIKSLYTKLQINTEQKESTESSASPNLCTTNESEDSTKKTTVDSIREDQEQDIPSSDDEQNIMANKTEVRGQKRSSDSSTPQSTKRRCSLDRTSVPLNPPSSSGVPRVLRKKQYEQISSVIWGRYERFKQTEAVYESKMKLREALFTIVKGVFPYCGLYIVGSSMNGFGSCSSDMDLCLMLSLADLDQKTEATEILFLLMKAIRRCSFLRDIQLIRAKVPILKFFDSVSGVQCDLNINNWVGIRNTHLLNAYSKVDYRICPLVQFVKYWASFHDINDASKGTLSSYSFVLMVLHYLQAGCQPAVIPSLQQKFPNKFSREIDIRTITLNETLPQFSSPNTCDVGELFVGFLYYYANFDFSFGVSVRLGGKVKLKQFIEQNPNVVKQWNHFGIEEPFDLSNTARAMYAERTFEHVRRVLRESYSTIRRTGQVESLFDRPF